MIQLQNVTKIYETKAAVDDVTIYVNEGESLVLLGKSGSGKTTLLKMINSLLEPNKGDIFFKGISIRNINKETLRREMGYVIQAIGLFPHMTVRENIEVVPSLLKWSRGKIDEQIVTLMDRLGLPPDFSSRYPHELSGGQQQRVGIARALAGNPSLLLMDEPFGALDPIVRKEIQQDFLNLDVYGSLTKVIVTHDVREAFALADRIALIDEGKLIALDTPHNMAFSPSAELVKSFIAEDLYTLKLTLVNVEMLLRFLQPEPVRDAQAIEQFDVHDTTLLQIFTAAHGPEQRVELLQQGSSLGTVTITGLQGAFLKYNLTCNTPAHD